MLPSYQTVRLARFIAAVAGLLLLPVASQPQQTPSITVDVQLVNVTATVEDDQGRPVANLPQEAFEVYEDGVLQKIAVFNNDELVPVSLGILFDTSGSMIDKIDGVRDAVTHFIETTNLEDDIFLLQFSSRIRVVQNFTDDRRLLKRSIRSLRPAGSTALYDAVVQGLAHLQNGRHQKKALLLITDGNDTSSKATLDDAMGTAQQAEAIVYALGIGHDERGSFGHVRGGFRDAVDARALHSITDVTGGRTVLLEGELHRTGQDRIDQAVQAFSDELRKQYTLGYYPSNIAADGRFHRIEVRTRERPYVVRSRAGYFTTRH